MSSDTKDWQFFAKTFLAGGIAGMTSKTTVAPLDRIKILLQVHNSHYKAFGVFSCLYEIVRKEGLASLYKGNGAQMVRIFPYAAVQFMSFEGYKRILENTLTKDSNQVNHELKFLAGSLAGVSAVAVTYPLDLTRARLASVVIPRQQQVPSIALANGESVLATKPKAPTSIVGTIVHVFKHENGMRGLYRGITPTILAMIPYGGCNFYIFERLKYFCVHYAPDYCCKRTGLSDKSVLNVPSKLLCGGIAGAIGQTAIFPLDVARRRMQLSMTSAETTIYSQSFVRALVITYQQHGVVKGLYRGMSVNYVRAVPMVAVSFCTYELLKQLLGIETGI